MNRKLIVVIVAVLAIGAVICYAKDRLSFSHTETLGDTEFVELQMDLAIAETRVRAGADDVLVDFTGEYDEDYKEPTMEVDRQSGGKTYIFLESGDSKHNKWGNSKDIDGADFDIQLSPKPEYAIRCDVGLGENNIDLTGLKVKRLRVDAGLAETMLVMDRPNEIEAERVEIESGLGSLESASLGNLRFRRLFVDAGMGDVTLDLQGYEGEGMVEVNVGMGSCDIIVPRGLGVRVYHDGGFMSSIDLDDMDKVRKGVYETDDYASASSKLEIDLSVGMGDVDLRWK